MATRNERGGWDLTDDDVAEVMAASFGDDEAPDPPPARLPSSGGAGTDTHFGTDTRYVFSGGGEQGMATGCGGPAPPRAPPGDPLR